MVRKMKIVNTYGWYSFTTKIHMKNLFNFAFYVGNILIDSMMS